MHAKKRASSPHAKSAVWDGWRPAVALPTKTMLESFDWASTELGALLTWPAEVLTVMDMMFSVHVPIAVLLGPQLRLVHNDAYQKILDTRRSTSMVGCPIFAVFPELKEALSPIYEAVLQGNTVYRPSTQLMLNCGNFLEEAYFDPSYTPIRLVSGAVVGIYTVVPEVTEKIIRKVVVILEQFKIDFPFAVLYSINLLHRRAQRVHAIGTPQSLPDLVSLDDPIDTYRIGAAALSAQIQTTGLLHSGMASREHPIRAHAVPVRAPRKMNGELHEVVAVLVVGHAPHASESNGAFNVLLRMISGRLTSIASISSALAQEHQQCEEQRRLNEAKAAFFGNISHEFRTTLTLMMAPLEELVQANDADLNRRYRLRLIHHNGTRLLRLVNNLLDFSLGESGMDRKPKRCTVNNFAALTTGLVQNFAFAAEAAGLTLSVSECAALPRPVSCDLEMWEKIVYNLVSNAVKFTRRGGQVSVALSAEGDNVRLVVRDTGIGISSEAIGKVFDRYFRVSSSQSGNECADIEGTGIGLALTRDLVKTLGGDIIVQSQLNVGTAFTVTLPILVDSESEKSICAPVPSLSVSVSGVPVVKPPLPPPLLSSVVAPAPIPSDGNDGTQQVRQAVILLVEDNDQVRGYVRLLLEQAAYSVVEASNGSEALQVLRARELPDLIISDVMMPVMDGLRLVAAVRSSPRLRSVPIILVSARGGEESKLSGLATTCDEYLLKPFTARELLTRVGTTIELVKQRACAVKEREANAMKDRFFAVVSHELRTPLTPVLLLAESIASDPSASDSIKQDAQLICHSMQLEMAMIDDLLDCAKLLRERLDLKVSVIDPLEVLSQSISLIKPVLEEKRQTLTTVQLSTQVSRVHADPVRLHQILWNLLKNAARFTRVGGEIQVEIGDLASDSDFNASTVKRVAFVVFRITDTGPGIESALLPNTLFELGTQGNTQRAGGLGIGLFLTKSLVERQGGSIVAENVELARGARFTFTLPAASTTAKSVAALPANKVRHSSMEGVVSTKEPLQGSAAGDLIHREGLPTATLNRKLRVLLVEDNTACRVVMVRLLEKKLNCEEMLTSPAEVCSAVSLADALRVVKSAGALDILISDIGLPDGDGWDLIVLIRQFNPQLRGIALSGYGASEDRQRSKQAGFSAHLVKPVRFLELSKAIESTLRDGTWRDDAPSSTSH